jgi:hypothetical protein
MCSHLKDPPPTQQSLDELGDRICELAAHLASATCRWLLMIAEFDEREGWAEWGVVSCAQWLSWRCSIGSRAAREHVRVARRLGELPLVRAAFEAGELSYCKVRALARVATERIEADLVEIARHATGAQLEKLVRGYSGAMSATVEAAQRSLERRFLRWDWEDDGSLRFQGRLSATDGALLLQALQAVQEPIREPDADVSGARADALVWLARAALMDGIGGLDDGQEQGDSRPPGAPRSGAPRSGAPRSGAPRSGGDPCEVVVHVDVETLARDEVHARSELAGGPAIAPETARRLACDAAVVRIVERDGEPLSVGRRTRRIPPALRRALCSRDRGCRFPGCDHTRFLHAHHIHHWAQGGRTDLPNLVHLCPYHHRLVHEGGYTIRRVGERGLSFHRPNGERIPEAPRLSRRGPGIEAQHGSAGVSIDGDTCRPKSAGDRLDYGLAVELLIHEEFRRRVGVAP